MKKWVTIKDIAQETGFTAQSVSRALRDKQDISEETKKIINETAKRLGYVKNTTASSLRHGRTNNIGVLYDTFFNPYFSIMTGYMQESLKSLGYNILIFTTNNYLFEQPDFDNMLSNNVDGIISFLEPSQEIEELVARYDIPVMLLGRNSDIKVDYIITNDEMGGKIAARRLIDEGCRNILHITENLEISCAKKRFEGFSGELKKDNLFNPDLVLSLKGQSFETAFDSFLDKNIKIDGIFAFNDILACEAIYALQKAGLSDVKVIGYDNLQENIKMPIKLTTIGFNKRQMAEVAAHVLVEKINGNKKLFCKIHDVFLIEGVTG